LRVLLDTHVWLWLQVDRSKLHRSRLELLQDEANALFLSAASAWEIAIKYAIGRLSLPQPPERYVPERVRANGITSLSVEERHALAVAALPQHHNDPFDRLLIAQANLEDMVILTADNAFRRYGVKVLRADRR
jgi:PIN domain nuclease of toxin-antitoxin system